jgi:hypothetical protein
MQGGCLIPNKFTKTAERLRWLLVMGILAANLVLLAMGLAAGMVGGELTRWGLGAGGLDGWADLSQTLFSLVVGGAAAVATYLERRSILVTVGVFFTGILIGVGYLMAAHTFDPCVLGLWDSATAIGDISLCDSHGEIAQRFHLLLHATFGVLSAGIAAVIYRREDLFVWWPWSARSDTT